MPCHTLYNGSSVSSKALPWARTKIEIEMIMNDELGNVLGHIKSNNDYSITATLLDRDGMTELMSKTFFYIEKDGDAKTCKKNGWEGLDPVKGKKPDEVVSEEAEKWLTDNYRTYVHTHESAQEVFEINNNFLV